MPYEFVFTRQSDIDRKKLKSSPYAAKARKILEEMREDPYKPSYDFEYLQKSLKGAMSKRINIQHRIVYEVFEKEKIIRILRMWTHYE